MKWFFFISWIQAFHKSAMNSDSVWCESILYVQIPGWVRKCYCQLTRKWPSYTPTWVSPPPTWPPGCLSPLPPPAAHSGWPVLRLCPHSSCSYLQVDRHSTMLPVDGKSDSYSSCLIGVIHQTQKYFSGTTLQAQKWWNGYFYGTI